MNRDCAEKRKKYASLLAIFYTGGRQVRFYCTVTRDLFRKNFIRFTKNDPSRKILTLIKDTAQVLSFKNGLFIKRKKKGDIILR